MPLPFLLNGIMESQKSGHLYSPKGSYDSIAAITVPSGGLASITFQGIPAGYRHLQIRASAIGPVRYGVQFNGDTGNNYSQHYLYGSGSGSAAAGNALNGSTLNTIGIASATTYFNATVADFLDYSSSTKNKVFRSLSGYDANGSGYVIVYSGLWLNTAPITSISIQAAEGNSGSFAQYSSFALYGVK